MCIIVMKPEGKVLSRKQLDIMWKNNPHGAGFMYAQDDKLHVENGIMKFNHLVQKLKEVGHSRKLVLHFRIRTHGSNDKTMTHPFWITQDKLALVHNGVIQNVANEATAELSDTYIFAKKLSEAYSDPLVAVRHPFHKQMIEAFVGRSKLVFMDNTGETYIFNESLGEWNNDIWYSNDKYKESMISVSQLYRTIENSTRSVTTSSYKDISPEESFLRGLYIGPKPRQSPIQTPKNKHLGLPDFKTNPT